MVLSAREPSRTAYAPVSWSDVTTTRVLPSAWAKSHFAEDVVLLVSASGPIDVRTLDHEGKAVGIFGQGLEGHRDHLRQGGVAFFGPHEVLGRQKTREGVNVAQCAQLFGRQCDRHALAQFGDQVLVVLAFAAFLGLGREECPPSAEWVCWPRSSAWATKAAGVAWVTALVTTMPVAFPASSA